MTTNYERIKNMTLDEMAEYIKKYIYDLDFSTEKCTEFCHNCDADWYYPCQEFTDGIKHWLQQESEE